MWTQGFQSTTLCDPTSILFPLPNSRKLNANHHDADFAAIWDKFCPFAGGRLLRVLHAPHHGVGCSERVGAPGMANGCTMKILVTLMSWGCVAGVGGTDGGREYIVRSTGVGFLGGALRGRQPPSAPNGL